MVMSLRSLCRSRTLTTSGCRQLEIDCWDGKDAANPIVTHGGSLNGRSLDETFPSCLTWMWSCVWLAPAHRWHVLFGRNHGCGLAGGCRMRVRDKRVAGCPFA
eukprot:5706921-Prymnesium_polylepis.2